MSMTRASSLSVLAVAVSGCGMSAGEMISPDAGTGGYCTTTAAVVSTPQPIAPATIEVAATIHATDLPVGFEEYAWQVRTEAGDQVDTEPRDPDARAIAFLAEQPGPYYVAARTSRGGVTCTDAEFILNVRAPGASERLFRLRLVPGPDQTAPAQEQIVEIPGGASYDLGVVSMSSGVPVAGTVRDESADGLAAYVRATPTGTAGAAALEVFADGGGAFSLRMESREHDVLVVPESSAVAPMRFPAVPPVAFSFVLSPGDTVTGVVRDPAGAALPGARVAVRVGPVPSTLATTDAGGRFQVLARLDGPATVTVVPPEAARQPRLVVPPGREIALGAEPVTIAYAAGLASRSVSAQVVEPDGATPAAGARVTWISRPIAGAGTLTTASGAAVALDGRVRVTQVADGNGALPAIDLTEAVYDVIIEPADGSHVSVATVDLGAGVPARLTMAPPAVVRGQIQDAGGAGLEGVRITAVPGGLLAAVPGAGASGTSSADGSFALFVVAGGAYELTLTSPGVEQARMRAHVDAPAAGQTLDLGALVMPRALRVSGRVSLAGSASSSGVIVRLLCYDCAGQDAGGPMAEAATDAAGQFVLAVPDPGVMTGAALRPGGPPSRAATDR